MLCSAGLCHTQSQHHPYIQDCHLSHFSHSFSQQKVKPNEKLLSSNGHNPPQYMRMLMLTFTYKEQQKEV